MERTTSKSRPSERPVHGSVAVLLALGALLHAGQESRRRGLDPHAHAVHPTQQPPGHDAAGVHVQEAQQVVVSPADLHIAQVRLPLLVRTRRYRAPSMSNRPRSRPGPSCTSGVSGKPGWPPAAPGTHSRPSRRPRSHPAFSRPIRDAAPPDAPTHSPRYAAVRGGHGGGLRTQGVRSTPHGARALSINVTVFPPPLLKYPGQLVPQNPVTPRSLSDHQAPQRQTCSRPVGNHREGGTARTVRPPAKPSPKASDRCCITSGCVSHAHHVPRSSVPDGRRSRLAGRSASRRLPPHSQ